MPARTGSYQEAYQLTRGNLRQRRQGLEEVCPEALDGAAESLTELRLYLHGHASDLSGDHSDPVWRRATRGEYVMDGADLWRLAIQAPDAAEVYLAPLVARLGYVLVPLEGTEDPKSAALEAAQACRATAELAEQVAEAIGDDELDDDELSQLNQKVSRSIREVVDVAVALRCMRAQLKARRQKEETHR